MTDAGTELRVGFKVQLVGLVLKRVDRVHMARRKPPSRDETQKRRFLRKTVFLASDWHLFHGRRSSVRIIEIHKGVLTEPEDALVQAALFTCPLLLVHQAV
ncbi:hypothetical protein KCU63_g61, partial [Aureobasidium melanogenum]